MKDELLPELKPGMVIVWDNASFHKSPKFTALIESAGCRILFLPPYSPDFNPIEQWRSALKANIRRIRKALTMTIPETLCKLLKHTH
jgi:transposase